MHGLIRKSVVAIGAVFGLIAAQTVPALGADAQAPTGNAARLQRMVEMSEKPWTQLLSQNALNFTPGETYLLSFWVKSSQYLTLRILTKFDQAPWTGLQEQKLEIGPEWTHQEVLLQSDKAEPNHTRLEFRYGGTEAGDIWIADVQLRPEADAAAPNMIQNGRFEEQLTKWYVEGLRPGGFSIAVEPVQTGAAP
jgi:hypothetical protein